MDGKNEFYPLVAPLLLLGDRLWNLLSVEMRRFISVTEKDNP